MFVELRSSELRIARTFKECTGLCMVELEELVEDTLTVLFARDFESEQHLRNTLHQRIKWAALNLHRARARHALILEHAAFMVQTNHEETGLAEDPARAYAAREQRLFVGEFLAQLTKRQREVFSLMADHRSYNAIAKVLEIPVGVARSEMRCCEQERVAF